MKLNIYLSPYPVLTPDEKEEASISAPGTTDWNFARFPEGINQFVGAVSTNVDLPDGVGGWICQYEIDGGASSLSDVFTNGAGADEFDSPTAASIITARIAWCDEFGTPLSDWSATKTLNVLGAPALSDWGLGQSGGVNASVLLGSFPEGVTGWILQYTDGEIHDFESAGVLAGPSHAVGDPGLIVLEDQGSNSFFARIAWTNSSDVIVSDWSSEQFAEL